MENRFSKYFKDDYEASATEDDGLAPVATVEADTGPIASWDNRTPEDRVKEQNSLRARFNRGGPVPTADVRPAIPGEPGKIPSRFAKYFPAGADEEEPPPIEEEEPGILGTAKSAGSAFMKGIGQTAAGIPKSLGLAAAGLGKADYLEKFNAIDRGEYVPRETFEPTPGVEVDVPDPWLDEYEAASPEERQAIRDEYSELSADAIMNSDLYAAGTAVDSFMKENFPEDPSLEGSFAFSKVPNALGQASLMIAEMAATRKVPRIGKPLSYAVGGSQGAAMNAPAMFEEALQDGATISEAMDTAGYAALLGTSEVLPIGRLFDRIDDSTGGAFRQTVTRMVKQGSEEAVQEALVEIGNAGIKLGVYDKETGLWDLGAQAGEAGAVGFTTGAILSFMADMILPGRRRGTTMDQPPAFEEFDRQAEIDDIEQQARIEAAEEGGDQLDQTLAAQEAINTAEDILPPPPPSAEKQLKEEQQLEDDFAETPEGRVMTLEEELIAENNEAAAKRVARQRAIQRLTDAGVAIQSGTQLEQAILEEQQAEAEQVAAREAEQKTADELAANQQAARESVQAEVDASYEVPGQPQLSGVERYGPRGLPAAEQTEAELRAEDQAASAAQYERGSRRIAETPAYEQAEKQKQRELDEIQAEAAIQDSQGADFFEAPAPANMAMRRELERAQNEKTENEKRIKREIAEKSANEAEAAEYERTRPRIADDLLDDTGLPMTPWRDAALASEVILKKDSVADPNEKYMAGPDWERRRGMPGSFKIKRTGKKRQNIKTAKKMLYSLEGEGVTGVVIEIPNQGDEFANEQVVKEAFMRQAIVNDPRFEFDLNRRPFKFQMRTIATDLAEEANQRAREDNGLPRYTHDQLVGMYQSGGWTADHISGKAPVPSWEAMQAAKKKIRAPADVTVTKGGKATVRGAPQPTSVEPEAADVEAVVEAAAQRVAERAGETEADKFRQAALQGAQDFREGKPFNKPKGWQEETGYDFGYRAARPKITEEALEAAAAEAQTSPDNDLPQPTPEQIEAGNYKKGHVKLQGLDISIENPRGSVRSSQPGARKQWSQEMAHHYGYIRRTEGADGDQIDTFIGTDIESPNIFVIDQIDQRTGVFDEHKAMIGFKNPAAAKRGYLASYEQGWKSGPVTQMSIAEFKEWIKTADTRQPASPKTPVATATQAAVADMETGPIRSRLAEEADPARIARAKAEGFDTDTTYYHATQQDFDTFEPGYEDGLVFVTDQPTMANNWAGLGKFRGRQGAEAEAEVEQVRENDRALRREIFDFEALNKLKGDEFTAAYDAANSEYQRRKDLRPDDLNKAVYPVWVRAKNTFDPRTDYALIEPTLLEMGQPEVIRQGLHKNGNWVVYENNTVVSALKGMGYDSMRLAENVDGPHETLALFNSSDVKSVNAQFNEPGSANILARQAETNAEVDPLVARATIARLQKGLPGIKATVVNTTNDLPPRYREHAVQRQGLRALYDGNNDQVWIVADQHNSVEDIEQTLAHEGVAHKGLRYVMGKGELANLLDDVYANGDQAGIADIARKYRLDVSDIKQQQEAAEEYIALQAEKGDYANDGLMQRVIAAVRRALRKAGMVRKWSDGDINALLREAHRTMEGTPAQRVTLQMEAEIAETGEVVTIEQPADRVIRQHEKRMNVIQQLKECIG